MYRVLSKEQTQPIVDNIVSQLFAKCNGCERCDDEIRDKSEQLFFEIFDE